MKKLLLLTMVLASFVSYGQTQTTNNEDMTISVIVLRYNGKPISISSIPKSEDDYMDKYSRVTFKFPKSSITSDDIIDLFSNYDWKVKSNIVYNTFSMGDISYTRYGHIKLPNYLSIKIETIKFK